MSDLQNLRISEIEEVSALADNDYLAYQTVDAQGHQHSYKVQFGTFKQAFIQKFMANGGFQSAASCDTNQFAPFAHGHDYNDFWYFSSYGPNSFNSVDAYRSSLCCICDGKFTVVRYFPGVGQSSTSQLSVWQPPVLNGFSNELSAYKTYKPGDVQLLAVKDFNRYLTEYRKYTLTNGNIDITKSSFDGFVIPDGSTFSCKSNEFKSACQMYSSNRVATATSFTVPDLIGKFFKCDPGKTSYPLSNVQSHTALVKHNHDGSLEQDDDQNPIRMKLNGLKLNFRTTQRSNESSDQYKNCIRGAKGTKGDNITPENPWYDGKCPQFDSIDLSCKIRNIQCLETSEDIEPCPRHVCIQALLYIGMPNE